MTTAAPAVTLRGVAPGDEEFLFRVYASTREEELAPAAWTEEQKEAFLRQQFGAQSAHWSEHYAATDRRIIEVDGVPAGRFYVLRGSQEIQLVDIALLPEYRGGGIGTRLIEELLAEAEGKGIPVTAHVEIFNPARNLYSRLRFAAVEERGMYLLIKWTPERKIS